MAEPGIFSLKEYSPNTNIQKTFEIPEDVLVNIFGENDIKIQVPDVNNFLNKDDLGTQKYEDDKKLFLDLVNNIRAQSGLDEQPVETLTEAQQEELRLMRQNQKEQEQLKAYIEDPLKEKNRAWREKLEADKRNWATFLPKGLTLGVGGRGREDLSLGVDEVLNYFGDSFMGLQNTTMRLYPEVNKQNVSIAGDFLSLLPLYFADRNKLLKGLVDPKNNPVSAGTVATTAGLGAYTAATAYDGLNALVRELEGLPNPELSTDPRVERLIHARNAMIFSGGAAALDPVFKMMKGLARWTYGVQKGTNAEYLAHGRSLPNLGG